MKAVAAMAPDVVEVVDIASPRVGKANDAVVHVTASGICGADLLPLSGRVPGFQWGTILGHEFVGIVSDSGPDAGFAAGTRVVASSTVSCGECWFCAHAMSSQCTDMALFGYSGIYPRLDGGQAQAVLVPHADRVLWALPKELDDDAAVFVADILPTAIRAVERMHVEPGGYVAVIGAGPVGLLAALLAVRSADNVVVLEPDAARRSEVSRLGLRSVHPDDGGALVRDETAGRGADGVVEASGSPAGLELALQIVRGRGTVSVSGAHFDPDRPMDVGRMFAKELSLRFAMGSPTDDRERAARMILSGAIDPRPLLTHHLPIEDAASAYKLFRQHQATKVLLCP